jgi:hypothetical protein
MDVRAVDQATCADAGAVGADEVRVVGARAAGLLALAPDAALGQFEDHPSRLRLDALNHPLIVTIEEQPATVNRLLTDAELNDVTGPPPTPQIPDPRSATDLMHLGQERALLHLATHLGDPAASVGVRSFVEMHGLMGIV